jgi:hypothetical protein
MKKADQYRQKLRSLDHWDDYLLSESGLPGPRANLELVQVVADEGDEALFRRYLSYDAQQAPVNTPPVFLAVCGVVGLGRLLVEGHPDALDMLRGCASDSRWRVREGVAMALQRWGDHDMGALLQAMEAWSHGTLLEKRAAAAALCEPRLLHEEPNTAGTLAILETITASIPGVADRKSDEFQALRKALGYCWSVAVAALPAHGKAVMGRWFASEDKDIRWIMKENLKKDRLLRMDAAWVEDSLRRLSS